MKLEQAITTKQTDQKLYKIIITFLQRYTVEKQKPIKAILNRTVARLWKHGLYVHMSEGSTGCSSMGRAGGLVIRRSPVRIPYMSKYP